MSPDAPIEELQRILALDTSSELAAVGVFVGGELCAELCARVRGRHGETLLPLVRLVLEQAGEELTTVDAIAVGLGPGSFTGTRIGVATAKGLALALGRPIVGVSSLRAIARGAPGAWVAPIVDAHKGEVYAALYERQGAELCERMAVMHGAPAEAAAALRERAGGPVVACGSGVRRYAEITFGRTVLPAAWDAPRAAVVALEAMERLRARGPDDLAALEPSYVRPSDAKLPP